jgi:hypothetical protein
LNHVLINWVNEIKNLVSLLLEDLNEWRLGDCLSRLTSDIEDIFLSFLHSLDVILEGDLILTSLGSVESKEISDLLSVSGVFVDTELEVLGELLVEFLVVFLVFSNFGEHFEALLDDVLLDNLKNFVLLKGLSGDVKWEIVGIDNTLNE